MSHLITWAKPTIRAAEIIAINLDGDGQTVLTLQGSQVIVGQPDRVTVTSTWAAAESPEVGGYLIEDASASEGYRYLAANIFHVVATPVMPPTQDQVAAELLLTSLQSLVSVLRDRIAGN